MTPRPSGKTAQPGKDDPSTAAPAGPSNTDEPREDALLLAAGGEIFLFGGEPMEMI